MKAAYFDCSYGIAGNMVLGALIDAGLSVGHLKTELNKLRIKPYVLRITNKKLNGINAILVDVRIKKERTRRTLNDILKLINRSKLQGKAKALSAKIFRRLASAEAKVHGIPVNKVHFHEVGAVDAIIDIVGSAVGLVKLGIGRAYSSPVNVGSGKIKHAHGILPVPAPASALLLKGFRIFDSGVKTEMATPTGAAILSTIARPADKMPKMKLLSVGYGAGNKTFKGSGALRVLIGSRN